jgi:hypothetical protein
MWGDTCGGVRKFAVIVFLISGGGSNRDSSLKFEAAYRLELFFNCEYFYMFLRNFFCSKYFIDYFQSIANFFGAKNNYPRKSKEI